MKSSSVLWGLLGLNVLLLMLFLLQGGRGHTAAAQSRAHPADYLMVPGEISGGPTEIVYIIDTSNGALGALTYDDASRTMQVMPAINLNSVFDAGISGKLK